MKRNIVCTLIICLLPFCLVVESLAQTPLELVGKNAPELDLEQLLQVPDDIRLDWKSLQGNVVILEFWATWCSPCVKAIPHLNELAEIFANDPVQFISITHENESAVSRSLRRREMRSWIGLDPDSSVSTAYNVTGIPTTVLVDAEGIIAAVTYPTQVSEQVIRDLLAGKMISLPQFFMNPIVPLRDLSTTAEEKLFYEITIKRAKNQSRQEYAPAKDKGSLEGAISLQNALSLAFDIPAHLIFGPGSLLKNKLEIQFNLPGARSRFFEPVLQEALQLALGFQAQRKTQNLDVFILQDVPGKAGADLYPSSPNEERSLSFQPGDILGRHIVMDDLCFAFIKLLKSPVVNETGLEGDYNLDFIYEGKGPEVVSLALKEQLGLELVAGRRELEVLVVEANDGPAALSEVPRD